MTQPLILTAAFDAADQARFDTIRRAHFPAERNLIPAHLTLFHHLPGEDLALIDDAIRLLAAHNAPLRAEVTALRSLGRGVAYTIGCPALSAIRTTLARAWHETLTPQDKQGWRPHVTIQNKVAPAEAASLLAAMQAVFAPFTVGVAGLLLWRYLGGPWELAARHDFTTTP